VLESKKNSPTGEGVIMGMVCEYAGRCGNEACSHAREHPYHDGCKLGSCGRGERGAAKCISKVSVDQVICECAHECDDTACYHRREHKYDHDLCSTDTCRRVSKPVKCSTNNTIEKVRKCIREVLHILAEKEKDQ
jgi:hypothetical protein